MAIAVFIILLISGGIFGLIGIKIAENKNVNATAAFWYGFFLGPIGLVIVALLNPDSQVKTSTPPLARFEGVQDLSSPTYKIWLANKYRIEKNELFDKFVISDEVFPSLEDALAFAHHAEQESIAAQKKERKEREAEIHKRHEAALLQTAKEAEKIDAFLNKIKFPAGAAALIIAAILAYYTYDRFVKTQEQLKISQKTVATMRSDFNEKLLKEDITPYPNTVYFVEANKVNKFSSPYIEPNDLDPLPVADDVTRYQTTINPSIEEYGSLFCGEVIQDKFDVYRLYHGDMKYRIEFYISDSSKNAADFYLEHFQRENYKVIVNTNVSKYADNNFCLKGSDKVIEFTANFEADLNMTKILIYEGAIVKTIFK
jgi:hypothetical protein